MKHNSRILIAGANGMVGRAITKKLQKNGYSNLYLSTRKDVDFINQSDTVHFFDELKPEYVFLAAAKVGGIMDNKTYPANFIYDNLMIQCNIIDSAYKSKVKKLLFLGSSCIYPKLATQPITKDQLLASQLEPTNDSYAIAKIAGIKMCQAYTSQYGFNTISLMAANLYGPYDNYDPNSSHVIPSFIRKFHEAKYEKAPYVICWGDGSPYREFMYVDDFADAAVHLMNTYDDPEIINVGTGTDITIKDLAEKIAKIIGYKEVILWDTSKPNGTPKKLLNVDKLNNECHWKHQINLDEGLEKTYRWYLENN